jgi:hypothetical protein
MYFQLRFYVRYFIANCRCLMPSEACTHIVRTPREAASQGKTREMDTFLAPALASYGGSRGASQCQSVFLCAQRCLDASCSLRLDCRAYSIQNGQRKCRLLIDLYKDQRSLWDPKHKNRLTHQHDLFRCFFIFITIRCITIKDTAARALCDAMVASYGLWFVLSRMLASLLSESTGG